MFALLAAVCFFLSLLDVSPGFDLSILGLLCIALHLVIAVPLWPGR